MRKKIVVAAALIAISTFNPSCKHIQHTDIYHDQSATPWILVQPNIEILGNNHSNA
ncbi:hypothetical protein [Arcticibacter tournemirensis]|uniref:hypothetical protein n=1 Tax=Arcticibacter tournemirensis TaxID=699437 RepID=UPI001386B1E2|nr:hypothetical protein [Arcticibacter tournemirensis]